MPERAAKALIDEPVTDAEVAQLRVLLADESMHQTPEDASWCDVLSRLLARIEQDAATIAQLTKERDEARAEANEANDPMAIALVADALNEEQEENHALRAEVARLKQHHCPSPLGNPTREEAMEEVARLRKVTGPDCPVCSKLLLAEHMLCVPGHHRDNAKDYYVCHDRKCRITVADLIANHPAIAREMGVSE